MISTFKDIFAYLKAPDCVELEDVSVFKKLNIVANTLFISLILCSFLAIFIGIIAHFELIDMDKHSSNEMIEKYSPTVVFLLIVIVAPIIEEAIFRAPITAFCKYKDNFKYIFYGIALVFGYIHITNYEISTAVILLSPFLVAPQIVLGFVLGYLRVKLGLIYSIILHMSFNAVLSIPALLAEGVTV